MKNQSTLYSRMVERTLLEDAPGLECLRCKIKSKMVDEVLICASPMGAGGDYLLCYDCVVETLDDVYYSLQEYYGSIR